MSQRIITGFALALLLSLGLLGTALAHAKLVSSDPAAGARLTTAPAKITLVFSEEISEKESDSSFSVTDRAGKTACTGKVDLSDLDHKTMTCAITRPLADGVYTVTWKVLTPDDQGHSEGSFTFGVNVDPGAQPTAAAHSHDDAAATAQPTAEAHTHTGAAATAQPAAAPASTAQPTAEAHSHAGAASPAPTLPKTGARDPNAGAYLFLAAVILLAGGLMLRRGGRRMQ